MKVTCICELAKQYTRGGIIQGVPANRQGAKINRCQKAMGLPEDLAAAWLSTQVRTETITVSQI